MREAKKKAVSSTRKNNNPSPPKATQSPSGERKTTVPRKPKSITRDTSTAMCIRKVGNWSNMINEHVLDHPDFNLAVFANDLDIQSPKMTALLDEIDQMDQNDVQDDYTLFNHVIYTNVNSPYGVKAIAAGLLTRGWKHAYEIGQGPRGKTFVFSPESNTRTFAMLTSTRFHGKNVGVRFRKEILEKFMDPYNSLRVIIIDAGSTDALELKDVKYLHLFEGLTNREMNTVMHMIPDTDMRELNIIQYETSIPKHLQPHFQKSSTLYQLFLKHVTNHIGDVDGIKKKQPHMKHVTVPLSSMDKKTAIKNLEMYIKRLKTRHKIQKTNQRIRSKALVAKLKSELPDKIEEQKHKLLNCKDKTTVNSCIDIENLLTKYQTMLKSIDESSMLDEITRTYLKKDQQVIDFDKEEIHNLKGRLKEMKSKASLHAVHQLSALHRCLGQNNTLSTTMHLDDIPKLASETLTKDTCIILGHGLETPVDFHQRFVLPPGYTVVLVSKCGRPNYLVYLFYLLALFRSKDTRKHLALSDPITYKNWLENYIDAPIRIYEAGDRLPSIQTSLLMDFPSKRNTTVGKSGVFRVGKVPKMTGAGMQQPQYEHSDIDIVETANAFSGDVPSNDWQQYIPSMRKGNLYSNVSADPGTLYKLADIITHMGPGVYWFPGCRSIHGHYSDSAYFDLYDQSALQQKRKGWYV